MLKSKMKATFLTVAGIIMAVVAYQSVAYKFDYLKSTSSLLKVSEMTADVRAKQLECLAKNIYYEAGYEPFEGKAAVAQVTVNRAESGKFPNDICKVIYQKNIVYDKVLCQFSWYCEGKSHLKPKNSVAYEQSMDAAKKVLLEGFRLPSLEKAIYYHADYVNPQWNKERLVKIGRHIFYSDRPGRS